LDTPVLNNIISSAQKGEKLLAILIDPDKASTNYLESLVEKTKSLKVDLFLVGGSLLTDGDLSETIKTLKDMTSKPVVIFPGSSNQIAKEADAILFLSLLSSRNPEMLIGNQVIAAPYIKKTALEVISTAYLLIDSGAATTASYISNSNPIPANKSEIAASTALAGQYMGMQITYLDGGSGAQNTIPADLIKKVRAYITTPIVVGGGIKTAKQLKNAYEAGADMVVIGDAFEKNGALAKELESLRSATL
jgi:putative glycerol-1-phosphate prenyltransferase